MVQRVGIVTYFFMNYIIAILSSLSIGTLFGYFVKDALERNSENRRRIRESREKQYTDFLNNLMGFFQGWEDEGDKSTKLIKSDIKMCGVNRCEICLF